MNTLTTTEPEIVSRYETNWIVASLPPEQYVSNNVWDLLRFAAIDRFGPAVRLLPRSRWQASACVELPLSAEAITLDLDRRLRRRLLPRCGESVEEPIPDDGTVTTAFAQLPGTLSNSDAEGRTFRPHVNDTGPLTLRLTPGGLSLRATLVALSDWPPLTQQAVGVFLGQVQPQLRLVRIVMDEEIVYLDGWADAEALAEDSNLVLDGFRQVVPRLRRSLHALTFDQVAQAYLKCNGKPD